MRIAVIGGLASGPAAAAEAHRENPDADIVLFEQSAHISIGACEIPYYIGDWIEEATHLEVLTPRQFEQTRGGTVCTRHRVTELRPRERTLTVEALDFGSVHEERFDRFILATGARPRRLGIEGEDAPNVFTVRDYDDAIAIKTYLETNRVRHAVVVGAGYIGIEMAEVLCARGVRATILEKEGRVLPKTLSPELGQHIDAAVHEHGVTVRDERATAFETDAWGRVSAIHTDKKEIIGCDLVIVAIGLEPRTELATAAGAKVGASGALAVDDGMKTSVPNLWACGDCVEVPRVLDGKPVHFPLALVGRRSARVAAQNAARSRASGRRATFAPVTRAIGVCAFGMEVARVGATVEEAREAGIDAVASTIQHWSRTKVYPGSKPIWVRLVVERGSGRILGGELVGAEGAALRADVLVPLIREGYTAEQVKHEIDLVYSPPIAPAVDPILIAASAAAKKAQEKA